MYITRVRTNPDIICFSSCTTNIWNNGYVVNNFCVLLLQVKGATPPLMSVHPIHARTVLRAWIMSMSLNAFVNLGGQAKHVMWTLMNAAATLVEMKDNALMNWMVTVASVNLPSMELTVRLILMIVQTRILVRTVLHALMALPLTLAPVPVASLVNSARQT